MKNLSLFRRLVPLAVLLALGIAGCSTPHPKESHTMLIDTFPPALDWEPYVVLAKDQLKEQQWMIDQTEAILKHKYHVTASLFYELSPDSAGNHAPPPSRGGFGNIFHDGLGLSLVFHNDVNIFDAPFVMVWRTRNLFHPEYAAVAVMDLVGTRKQLVGYFELEHGK